MGSIFDKASKLPVNCKFIDQIENLKMCECSNCKILFYTTDFKVKLQKQEYYDGDTHVATYEGPVVDERWNGFGRLT